MSRRTPEVRLEPEGEIRGILRAVQPGIERERGGADIIEKGIGHLSRFSVSLWRSVHQGGET